jgi:hypothetical protein
VLITRGDDRRRRLLKRTFRKPTNSRVRQGSRLLLLRRDLQELLGPEDAQPKAVEAPLLAALGISAGFELLAKYWSGKADTTPHDVEMFLHTVVGVRPSDAAALVQLRHALAHGYGLKTWQRGTRGRPLAFRLMTEPPRPSDPVVQPKGTDSYIVNLWLLRRLFLGAVGQCRRVLAKDYTRLYKFELCTWNLAGVAVSGRSAERRRRTSGCS